MSRYNELYRDWGTGLTGKCVAIQLVYCDSLRQDGCGSVLQETWLGRQARSRYKHCIVTAAS